MSITQQNYSVSGDDAGKPVEGTETLNSSSEASSRLPPSTAAPEYPYNNATVTRAGHEMHWDDTPGHERIRLAHRAGTYFEISEDGRKVELVSANEYKYTKGGLTLTVDKNGDIKVGGLFRLVIGGDAHVEINGDVTASIGGSLTAAVNKNAELHVGESATVTAGQNITATADQNIYASAGQDLVAAVGGNMTAVVQGDSTELTLGNRSFQVGGEYKIVASSIVLDATGSITTKGSAISTTGNVITTDASGTITTHANTITSQANTISSIIPHP